MAGRSQTREPQMHEKLAGSSSSLQDVYEWRSMLAKFTLLFFGIAMWYKWPSYYGYSFLVLIWILDGGLRRFKQTIREPFVLAILVFCAVLALGILWSDYPKSGYFRWNKYFVFLVFIPLLSLLNKERLPWAISGLLIGYFSVFLTGVYQWVTTGEQGTSIPDLIRMNYLHFSVMLGIGVILALYLAGTNNNRKISSVLWLLAVLFLFIQFNQHGRGPLLATVLTSVLLIFMLYRTRIKTLLGVMASLIIVILVFAYSSDNFQERVAHAQNDIELIQQEKYATSLGYRLAIWDIGLHAIAQKPLFGHGSGMALSSFEENVETYKGGLYTHIWKEPKFHYHNDLIEIGIYVGAIGLMAYAFLLWSWFQTLRAHQLGIFGAALVCYVFLAGLTDTTLIYNSVPTLLLAITAIAISWQKETGAVRIGPGKLDSTVNELPGEV